MKKVLCLIFAKYPTPGAVKTRLAATFSAEAAASLHRASLMAVVAKVLAQPSAHPVLSVSPDESLGAFGDMIRGAFPATLLELWPQGAGDLGARLARSVKRAFELKPPGVLLLGSDSPTMPDTFLETAIGRLGRYDAVLGPAEDGGYYLLGLRRPRFELFEGIDWGKSTVAAQTRARARQLGMTLYELPYWYDLDRATDLELAVRDLSRYGYARNPFSLELFRLVRGMVMKGKG